MFDLDGKSVQTVLDEQIENNKMDDFEDTIDLTEVVEEVMKNA